MKTRFAKLVRKKTDGLAEHGIELQKIGMCVEKKTPFLMGFSMGTERRIGMHTHCARIRTVSLAKGAK